MSGSGAMLLGLLILVAMATSLDTREICWNHSECDDPSEWCCRMGSGHGSCLPVCRP
uniref:Conotoxin Cal6.41a n=1 Tax=Californiconus californicus TaxID=1736779 RepID=C61A_CONCL|nr:RecName: Full=Conotoxin Cal6.41a; AltName: Full=O3_cal6.1a; Flags: Precursor [Californiconus californicus]